MDVCVTPTTSDVSQQNRWEMKSPLNTQRLFTFKKRTLSKDLVPKTGGQKFILTLVPEWVKIKWIWGKAVTMFQPEFSGVFN